MFNPVGPLVHWLEFFAWSAALVGLVVFLLAADSIVLSHPHGERLTQDHSRHVTMLVSGWVAVIGAVTGFVLTAMAVWNGGY
jgi:hypothetical protein